MLKLFYPPQKKRSLDSQVTFDKHAEGCDALLGLNLCKDKFFVVLFKHFRGC